MKIITELKSKPEGMEDIRWLKFLFLGSNNSRKSLRKKLPTETLNILEDSYEQQKLYEKERYFESVFKKKKKYTKNKEYISYINSKAWRDKRKEKLSIQDSCEVCGSKENLHVHHNNYNNFKNENMEDLNVLCAKCHSEIHK